ncbi:LysM peptidoglycan-binding domain-containing protein [Tenuibacillus multivorans]|uniref:Spore germination protein n=1 Tax=Tenuibacillus multivorans TaxID=237069 RepID=A0A1H0ANL5_9BACI|nr:LysM peptidoglycan-binding domain-containing protein [Tenuibacillus multivorans]GEL78213.1 germination protein [Tenuibacillus multivorans]SDN34884.1 spore germination protein [Tenuibacillus multivorans]
MNIHVVRSGDTLWQIARRYGSDINQIALANGLEDEDVLVVGQALVVPNPETEYVIQPGDALWEIAQRYNVPLNELAAYNNIVNPSLIFVGDMLVMPYRIHTVSSGETLWIIANQYQTTVSELVQSNAISNPSLIQPGQKIRVPMAAKPFTEVNAYATDVDESGRGDVLDVGRHLTYLMPFTYTFREDGTITTLNEQPVLEAAYATNTTPILVMTNFVNQDFDSDLMATLLRNPDIQETFINNLLNIMRQKGYVGVNFDFEYVYPEDRENYNNFLRRVVNRLRPEGLLTTTALAPKDSGEQTGLLYEAHDYPAHGEIVDFVVLMTYEWGWAGGEPWAIAPIDEVREVLDYAVQVIPRNKILMGIPLYGRDWDIPWEQGTFAETVSLDEALDLANRYGANIQYHTQHQSPYFQYTDETGQRHEVWFEDARSMRAKYKTIKDYGLRGASYWALGIPLKQNWLVLQNEFRIRKI